MFCQHLPPKCRRFGNFPRTLYKSMAGERVKLSRPFWTGYLKGHVSDFRGKLARYSMHTFVLVTVAPQSGCDDPVVDWACKNYWTEHAIGESTLPAAGSSGFLQVEVTSLFHMCKTGTRPQPGALSTSDFFKIYFYIWDGRPSSF